MRTFDYNHFLYLQSIASLSELFVTKEIRMFFIIEYETLVFFFHFSGIPETHFGNKIGTATAFVLRYKLVEITLDKIAHELCYNEYS